MSYENRRIIVSHAHAVGQASFKDTLRSDGRTMVAKEKLKKVNGRSMVFARSMVSPMPGLAHNPMRQHVAGGMTKAKKDTRS